MRADHAIDMWNTEPDNLMRLVLENIPLQEWRSAVIIL